MSQCGVKMEVGDTENWDTEHGLRSSSTGLPGGTKERRKGMNKEAIIVRLQLSINP